MGEGAMLFRDNFLAARRLVGLGSVIVQPQRAALLASFVMLSLIVVAVCAAASVKYTRYDRFTGYASESVQRAVVSSPFSQGARVDEVYVSLGEVVVPGQPIALLSGSGRALGERPESFNAFVYPLQDPADKQGETFVLSSTLRGAVDRLQVRPGAVASFAQPIAVVRGSSEGIRLQALVPSHSITEVAVGSEVYLKFDAVQASDMEAIKTRVRSISRAPLGPAELAATFGAATSPEPMFLVDLDSGVLSEHPVRKLIRPGVGFRMTVPAERKSLLRWLTGYKDEKA